MSWNCKGRNTQSGDLVQLVGLSFKSYIFVLEVGKELHTHRGVVKHDDLIGLTWGSQIFSHIGSPFFLLQPSLPDLLKNTPRATQILYPKDIAHILLVMGIGPGLRVTEAGTGSGALTTALAYSIGTTGKVYTYENREEHQLKAKKNLDRLGLSEQVEFKLKDIAGGFEEIDVDALFLDVANPYDYIAQVRATLKPGGYFGCIVPTSNQVMSLLIALRHNEFAFIDVCEISLRYYKPEPSRFRPTDRMIAHTGFLVFARPVTIDHERVDKKLLKETGAMGLSEEREWDELHPADGEQITEGV
ncbi:MAG: tRNA (adenine-N1)-methyltransferase [Anaerolineaceae bacterium]